MSGGEHGLAPLILAAGGIVTAADGSDRIAVIYRELYGPEWALPKGKQEPGESLEQTAVREVAEETGCSARITGFAGATSYLHGRAPKVVVFWTMQANGPAAFGAGAEVRGLAWLPPAAAAERLTHAEEARLVRRLYGLEPRP